MTDEVKEEPRYTLRVEFEFAAATVAEAYSQVADLLSKVVDPTTIKKVDLNPVGKSSGVLPGHVPGCRATTTTTRGGTDFQGCTCYKFTAKT